MAATTSASAASRRLVSAARTAGSSPAATMFARALPHGREVVRTCGGKAVRGGAGREPWRDHVTSGLLTGLLITYMPGYSRILRASPSC